MTKIILLKKVKKPLKVNLRDDLEWLCEALCLSNPSKKELMVELLDTLFDEISKKGYVKTSTLAKRLRVQPQKVNYHLKTLISSGIFYREGRAIYLRQSNLKETVEELREDVNRLLDDISEIAEEIDKSLGLRQRK